MRRVNLSKAKLEKLYLVQQLSTNEIGKIYNYNQGTIWYWLHKYQIPIRNNREASTVGDYKSGKIIPLPVSVIVHLYQELRMPLKMIGKKYNCSKWTIGERLKGAGVVIRKREEALTDFGREVFKSFNYRAKQAEISRKYWTEDKQRRMMLGCQRKPNKPEGVVLDVLNSYFPNEWRYVGDGSVIIDGLNPDFINVNGRKLIIELFGEYWHRKGVRKYHQTERGRREVYRKYGYDTLIIWEKETKNLEFVLEKVTKFINPKQSLEQGE